MVDPENTKTSLQSWVGLRHLSGFLQNDIDLDPSGTTWKSSSPSKREVAEIEWQGSPARLSSDRANRALQAAPSRPTKRTLSSPHAGFRWACPAEPPARSARPGSAVAKTRTRSTTSRLSSGAITSVERQFASSSSMMLRLLARSRVSCLGPPDPVLPASPVQQCDCAIPRCRR